ncbi:MAG TPA: YetF domain-containing protein, partial [Gaiellaceae bacterium]|nr:YetF domain-containing protein [Gaiellaceae bacterium]
STLEPFDLILLIVLGDLIQQGVTQNDFSVTGAMLAGGTMAVMTVLFSWLAFRFRRLQPILEGDPVILVERGKTIDRNLQRNRITLEELAAQARMQQVAHIVDIEWAVLETSGTISVIPKSSS